MPTLQSPLNRFTTTPRVPIIHHAIVHSLLSTLRPLRRPHELKTGTRIWNRGHQEAGTATGTIHLCRLEGCSGIRVAVRWPNGKITYPCSKGLMRHHDKSWEIL